jgi:hypothetical protein
MASIWLLVEEKALLGCGILNSEQKILSYKSCCSSRQQQPLLKHSIMNKKLIILLPLATERNYYYHHHHLLVVGVVYRVITCKIKYSQLLTMMAKKDSSTLLHSRLKKKC